MKRVLKPMRENESSQNLLNQLKREFGNVTDAFEALLVPFSLSAIGDEGKVIKFKEAELTELTNDYEDFKKEIKQLIRTTVTFIRSCTTSSIGLRDDGFVAFISNRISEVVSLYNNVLGRLQEEGGDIFTKIQNAFIAYLMLARVLNTAIHYYNEHHIDNQIPEIKNIPDPQYLNFDNNISIFFTQFIQDINKYLD
jgi:hypothetical protein